MLVHRNHVPWALIAACNLVSALLLLSLRYMLARENKRRDMAAHDETFDAVYVSHVNADGTTVKKKVDKVRRPAFSNSTTDLRTIK